MTEALIPDGAEVPFSEVESLLARTGDTAGESARALTATIVAIGPDARIAEAAAPLRQLGESGAVRAILIGQNHVTKPASRVAPNVVALGGIRPSYVDNAVAALRLSSLPTLIWWRGGAPESLDGLASLADRIVLDAEAPEPSWKHALDLLDDTAFSDLRWTRLTRWRALMAQFFEIPAVREAASDFKRLSIEGADAPSCTLFGAWMKSSLEWDDRVAVEIRPSGREAGIESIATGNGKIELMLRLARSRRCVETAVKFGDAPAASRVVSLGDRSLTALLSEELRVRSRDAAFERALRAALTSIRA